MGGEPSSSLISFRDLDERATEVAGVPSVNDLWATTAQTLIYDLRDALRRAYPATPVDCLISELRDEFFPVLSHTSVLTLAEFDKRVSQFRTEIAE